MRRRGGGDKRGLTRGIVCAMRALAAALATLLWSLAAEARVVAVESAPARATLVCDGRVLGVTPLRFDPDAFTSCTLFAAGHRNLALLPTDFPDGAARFTLERVAAVARRPAPPCGRVDAETGLVVPCAFAREAQAVTPRCDARRRCGCIAPSGLLIACLGDAPAPAAPRATMRACQSGRDCDCESAAGLVVPCL